MKEGRKQNIFVTLSINQIESQQNFNMKPTRWRWARSYSIELNMFLELQKLTTDVNAEKEW